MESPFATANSSVVLYLEPYLNTFFKSYQNIITLSSMPSGPLSNLVSTISSPKLSPFHDHSPFSSPSCTYVLMRYPCSGAGASGRHSAKNPDYFMGADDIPSVFSYLQSNGYSVDTNTTNMLQNGRVVVGGVSDKRFSGNRRMIAMITLTTG